MFLLKLIFFPCKLPIAIILLFWLWDNALELILEILLISNFFFVNFVYYREADLPLSFSLISLFFFPFLPLSPFPSVSLSVSFPFLSYPSLPSFSIPPLLSSLFLPLSLPRLLSSLFSVYRSLSLPLLSSLASSLLFPLFPFALFFSSLSLSLNTW